MVVTLPRLSFVLALGCLIALVPLAAGADEAPLQVSISAQQVSAPIGANGLTVFFDQAGRVSGGNWTSDGSRAALLKFADGSTVSAEHPADGICDGASSQLPLDDGAARVPIGTTGLHLLFGQGGAITEAYWTAQGHPNGDLLFPDGTSVSTDRPAKAWCFGHGTVGLGAGVFASFSRRAAVPGLSRD